MASDKSARERFVEAMRDILDRHYAQRPEHVDPANSCGIRFYGVEAACDAFADADCSDGDEGHAADFGLPCPVCRAAIRKEVFGE